jgi:hypothetical protein
MIGKIVIALAAVLSIQRLACAHAVDEYLQATLIALEGDRIEASVRLVPGMAVFPQVLADIDANSDRVFSESEQLDYARRFLGDLSLSIDGVALQLKLVSVRFSSIDRLREGLGAIQIELRADLPAGASDRTLVFENHHRKALSAYLMNSQVPRDRNLRIVAQDRNEDQSVYRPEFARSAGR